MKIFLSLILLLCTFTAYANNHGTIIIEVSYIGDQYSIEGAWKTEKTFPPSVNSVLKKDDDIIIKIKDAQGVVVENLRVPNPKLIHAIMAQDLMAQDNEKTDPAEHNNRVNNEGAFLIYLNYKEGIKYLNIINASQNVNAMARLTNSKHTNDLNFKYFLK